MNTETESEMVLRQARPRIMGKGRAASLGVAQRGDHRLRQSLGVPRKDTSMQRSLFSTLIVAGALSVTSIALANDLDVPVLEEGGNGDIANCSSNMVSGLKANRDGFLAVRSGPGIRYCKIDELHNGDTVVVFDERDKWLGIVYRTSNVHCDSTRTRPVSYEKRGWVHSNWIDRD